MTIDARVLLAESVRETPWIDTHEHLVEERHRLRTSSYEFRDEVGSVGVIPGDWTSLLFDYAINDFVSAGLPSADVSTLASNDDPGSKWQHLSPYLPLVRNTGFVSSFYISVQALLGVTPSAETIGAIDAGLSELRRPGYYAYILHDIAGVERCHVNSLETPVFCETKDPAILDQDLSILGLCTGSAPAPEEQSGIRIDGLESYERVLDWCFDRYASQAIAIKSQWAYERPLALSESRTAPREQFERLRGGTASALERRQVEDYIFRACLDRAERHELPVKLHLGYLAGNGEAQFPNVFAHPAEVAPIVSAYPNITFVLMHAAWPQQEQLLAMAKHYPNVVVDLCWAWILAPLAARDFVRRFLTTAPAGKLLCFGGDFRCIESVPGHAAIARNGLASALGDLVADGWLDVSNAGKLVPLLMRENAERIFSKHRDVPRTNRFSSRCS